MLSAPVRFLPRFHRLTGHVVIYNLIPFNSWEIQPVLLHRQITKTHSGAACRSHCHTRRTMEDGIAAPPLPSGTQPLKNQVAGHKHGQGKTKMGMLEVPNGILMKAVQHPPRGTCELNFYNMVFDPECQNRDLISLRQFLPCYHGTEYFKESPEVPYLKLENIVSKFRKPCVADFKMGQRTYDPEASEEKQQSEMTKYPFVMKFGFSITGMQVYNPLTEEFVHYDKFYGRKLAENEMLVKGVGPFFNLQHSLRKDAVLAILQKLENIEKWFVTQRKLAFYASSLLLVYEGDVQDDDRNIQNETETKTESNVQNGSQSILSQNAPLADVRMIDFTHVFEQTEQDDNYLYGVRCLMQHLKMLLDL